MTYPADLVPRDNHPAPHVAPIVPPEFLTVFNAWTAKATSRVSMQIRITVERRQGRQNGARANSADHGPHSKRT